jgi:outer membrane protein assembly factor BamD
MLRRLPVFLLLGVLAFTAACTNKKVRNPIAKIDSKQPDKVLFDKAMDAMKHNRFDVARITLQTLINTYPDSEFLARGKLAVADSWYAEGGSASLAQAEIEYNDFITFFPNMPESAEAQLKIANIHYQQMEKPDRDYTHALRAEDEYRKMINQFPDSKLVPECKQRLREVQEVIAEREFRVGRFYYLRESYPASIARLQSLVDRYPLYSKADESLYLLGQSYEGEIGLINRRATCSSQNTPAGCVPEAIKARMVDDFTKRAAEAYSKIMTRYPLMNRNDDAKLRLAALHQPVPRPTRAAIAQNKAEEDSRRESSTLTKVMRSFNKHPDVAQASKVGEPTLNDPKPVSASDVVQQTNRAALGSSLGGKNSVSVEAVGTGNAAANAPVPRSDALPTPDSSTPGATQPDPNESKPNAPPGPTELKPNAQPDPNELQPNLSNSGDQPAPPPQQVNEIQPGSPDGKASAGDANGSNLTSSTAQEDDTTVSSSKHKKKKGLRKMVPF